ncbi:hypothetical protein [Faecalibacillus intestinalis]|uniref:hypothetical protein n=1 Tax=Faecalibacillus intestinalis TaxID=1982626 RepID=UPI0035208930
MGILISKNIRTPGTVAINAHRVDSIEFNSINNKKSCFVDEDDLNYSVEQEVLSSNHYNDKYQDEFDKRINY